LNDLMKDIPFSSRQKLYKIYERDFTLLDYKWNTETNEIF
jgi:hypothetical protein